eukprot:g9171.t1
MLEVSAWSPSESFAALVLLREVGDRSFFVLVLLAALFNGKKSQLACAVALAFGFQLAIVCLIAPGGITTRHHAYNAALPAPADSPHLGSVSSGAQLLTAASFSCLVAKILWDLFCLRRAADEKVSFYSGNPGGYGEDTFAHGVDTDPLLGLEDDDSVNVVYLDADGHIQDALLPLPRRSDEDLEAATIASFPKTLSQSERSLKEHDCSSTTTTVVEKLLGTVLRTHDYGSLAEQAATVLCLAMLLFLLQLEDGGQQLLSARMSVASGPRGGQQQTQTHMILLGVAILAAVRSAAAGAGWALAVCLNKRAVMLLGVLVFGGFIVSEACAAGAQALVGRAGTPTRLQLKGD